MTDQLEFDIEYYKQQEDAGGRELYIFKWLSSLEEYLETSAAEKTVSAQQEYLEELLLEIVTIPPAQQRKTGVKGNIGKILGSQTVPRPSRVVRGLVAKSLARLYELGQMHRMDNVIAAIHIVMQDKRSPQTPRLAALEIAGVLFEALGQRAGFRLLSSFNDFLAIGLRIIRTSAESVSVRVEATKMLARLLMGGGGKTATEQQARDCLRTLRPNLGHRSPLLVMVSAEALCCLAACTPYLSVAPSVASPSSNASPVIDPETFVAGLVPLLANPVLPVRRALGRLIAVIMAHNAALPQSNMAPSPPPVPITQSAAVSPRTPSASVRNSIDLRDSPTPRRGTLSLARVSDVRERNRQSPTPPAIGVHSPPPVKQQNISVSDGRWALERVLGWLGVPFSRHTTSRELRAGIADAYAALFDELGGQVVAAHYGVISGHLIAALAGVADAENGEGTARAVSLWLLHRVATLLPNEDARMHAASVLWETWIAHGTRGAGSCVAVALGEWRRLVIGETALDWDCATLEAWLAHPFEPVRVQAAAALGAWASGESGRAAQLAAQLATRLQQTCAEPGSERLCAGLALAISAVLETTDAMHVPQDLGEWIHALGVRLLNISGNSTQQRQQTAGWTLLAGATAWGAEFAQQRLPQWRRLWAMALPADGGFMTASMSWAERAHQLQRRNLALAHVLAALRQPEIGTQLSLDTGELATGLRAAMQFADNALDAPPPSESRTGEQQSLRAAVLDLHVCLRWRLAECLAKLAALGGISGHSALAGTAMRLAELAIAGPANMRALCDARFAVEHMSPSPSPSPAPQRLSRGSAGSSTWTYEVEVGVTSLLSEVVGDVESEQTRDFARGTVVAEPDWLNVATGTAGAATGLVDAAVQLWGSVFAGLAAQTQVAQLSGVAQRLNRLKFGSHRHMAALTNAVCGLAYASRKPMDGRVARAAADMAVAGLSLPSAQLRAAAGVAIGQLAAAVSAREANDGGAYIAHVLRQLSGLAIRARDRFARAGAAVALGALYARAGALVARGNQLRDVTVLLHSLASDNDPIVHTWALRALTDAALSAGYMFAPYARDTLRMALKLMLSDAHTVPFYASAIWVRGRDLSPSSVTQDSVLSAREMPASLSSQQLLLLMSDSDVHVSTAVASGRDAALTHPDSRVLSGRSADEPLPTPTSEYPYVCACDDVDATDARAALGQLVGALQVVLGPELYVDEQAQTAVTTVVRELRRALASVVPTADGRVPVIDPNARWETAVSYILSVQRQLLFTSAGIADNAQLNLLNFVQMCLRPVLRARCIAYYGLSERPIRLQRVAVTALESVLRLYGSQLFSATKQQSLENTKGSEVSDSCLLCEIVWDAACLHNNILDCIDSESLLLVSDLQTLIRTAVVLAFGTDSKQPFMLLPIIETLCAVITRFPSPNLPPLNHLLCGTDDDKNISAQKAGATVGGGTNDGDDDEAAAQFSLQTRHLAFAALLSTVDAVPKDTQNLLLPLLPDMLRVGYLAASLADRLPKLGCLGLGLLQRLVDLFASVDDPKMPEDSVLVVYQAQLDSALAATLPADLSKEKRVQEDVRRASMTLATSYLLAPRLVRDRMDMLRLLRHLAPQPIFEERKHVDKRVWRLPMQLHVVERLSILRVWARILIHASNGERDRKLNFLKESLLLHLPLLVEMWLAAVRDAVVVEIDTRDICEELDTLNLAQLRLDTIDNNSSLCPVDVGLGLVLGLDSADLRLLRSSMAVWFRYYLPPIIDALAILLGGPSLSSSLISESTDDWLASGRSELLRQLGESSDRALWLHLYNCNTDDVPSKSALLMLCAGLQHLPRTLNTTGNAANFMQLSSRNDGCGTDSCDPFIAKTIRDLIGVLDLDRFHITDDQTSNSVDLIMLAKLRMSQSLLTMIATLLSFNDRLHLGTVFSVSMDKVHADGTLLMDRGEVPWLLRELWARAVTTQLQGIAQLDGISANPSVADCELRLDVALKAMEVADSLMRLEQSSMDSCCKSTSLLLRNWLFDTNTSLEDSDLDVDTVSSLDRAIGYFTPFGAAVLRDIIIVWKSARNIMLVDLVDSPSAQLVVITALRVLARIIAMAYEDTSRFTTDSFAALEKLWFGMWSQSVASHIDTVEAASELLSFFVNLVENVTSHDADKLIKDDHHDKGNITQPSLMQTANSMLAQQLLGDENDNNSDCGDKNLTPILAVIARLCCGTTFVVHPVVRQRFVEAYGALLTGCLESNPSNSAIRLLEEVPACLQQQMNFEQCNADMIVSLARESIPLLARLVYGPNNVARAALNALVYFASASGYDTEDDTIKNNKYTCHTGVLATVLMLLLAMLPSADIVGAELGEHEQFVAESILCLATKCPILFKNIVRVLAAAHPDAKRRLEIAIRFGAGVPVENTNGTGQQQLQNNSTATVDGSVVTGFIATPDHPAIVLKNNFAI
ncbi:hypothetical protein COEREDRAFT_89508 [Coemansia reversa NRRL 1564]|uniref:ARM repeat-containing protein n=1 Tax=Coemansia reversa (strain ATCC 12441 / NRRL 1564) TaxID=763665 RepID=A0A2G5B3F6_COERN|nr:hypothetical protein COEREDRAFT_89508 [Coemansia reversa NRRL 1564]|eukprot:PIA13534.1 hypothetical protein COEREDRAFT_89508 [Coemansia reversa NRRL 1564]